MEVFIRNLPLQTTEDEIRRHVEPALRGLSISQFYWEVLRNKGCAKLTILDREKGNRFLTLYGSGPGRRAAQLPIILGGKRIQCLQSRNQPAAHILRALSLGQQATSTTEASHPKTHERPSRTFECSAIHCGVWDYNRQDLVFISHFQDQSAWKANFGKRSCTIAATLARRSPRLVIPYSSVHSLTVGSNHQPSFTLSLTEAPRISACAQDNSPGVEDASLDNLLRSLLKFNPSPTRNRPDRKRISGLDSQHATVAAGCLVYRLLLKNANDCDRTQLLRKARDLPPNISHETALVDATKSFGNEISDLHTELSISYRGLSFRIRFQLQKLAQNGLLQPRLVRALLPIAVEVARRSGADVAAQVFQKLENHISFPGPETTADEIAVQALTSIVMGLEKTIKWEKSHLGSMQKESEQHALIHKAMVTPTGVHLDGPHLDTKNRVIRKYSSHTDHFLRVIFCDEDWEPCRFDREVSLAEIFHERFQNVLDVGINIAGLRFEFLGFSHSSLRAASCWFMAPFVDNGRQLFAGEVIRGLGDFSKFRSPAKCAARIGQAFSDTVSSIPIPLESVREIEDVVRNGSTFSDGVGTISPSILRLIWNKHGSSRIPKPTLFQFRYAGKLPVCTLMGFNRAFPLRAQIIGLLTQKVGAKGMISLDTRLKGDVICLRPSMIKFQGSRDKNLEICQAAKLLPLFLNQQYIKILEDQGVDESVFLEMQKQDVAQLRKSASSPTNAANFLERESIGQAAKLPFLLRKLQLIGLSFQADRFLRNAVELRMLIRLREIKYRSRLRVEQGCVLYGIMDETDFLKEGEVFCTFQKDNISTIVLTGRVVVTRPPALHPGDIQTAQAVMVPEDSPLRELCNCIVFSQQGSRSLPSMLGGGDLDGDTYAVIYDTKLRPKYKMAPAEYLSASPIDINRQVERRDITQFLIQFMENDQLGRIAMLHRSLADKSLIGTSDPDCVKLAEMHSTAVDFSKTGIQVDMSRLPKQRGNNRPDFMASGPRVQIDNNVDFLDEQDGNLEDDEFETTVQMKYYQSGKVLGKLYRAIDEQSFLMDLRALSQASGQRQGKDLSDDLLPSVWKVIKEQTVLMQWDHHLDFAQNLREMYEENMMDIMSEYSVHPRHPPHEVEVFMGALIDRDGKQSKRQREYSMSMYGRIERDIAYFIDCIRRGPSDDEEAADGEALARSIACVAVAMEKYNLAGEKRVMRSWSWVAVTTCLRQMEDVGIGVL